MESLDRVRPERWLGTFVALVGAATLIGVVLLWPRGDAPELGATAADLDYVEATVTGTETVECLDSMEQLEVQCQRVEVEVTSGVTAGQPGAFLKSLIDRRTQQFETGDQVVLSFNPLAPPDYRYVFFEHQRDTPLIVLAVAFVAIVLAFGRWKGARALAGLAV